MMTAKLTYMSIIMMLIKVMLIVMSLIALMTTKAPFLCVTFAIRCGIAAGHDIMLNMQLFHKIATLPK